MALLAGSAESADLQNATLAKMDFYPVLRLADGRLCVPGGIVVPVDAPEVDGAAAGMVEEWLDRGPFTLDGSAPISDRHGRLRQMPMRAGASLETALVGAGLAIVAPDHEIAAGPLRSLLMVEEKAREAQQGVWATATHGPYDADAVPQGDARFVLVEGRIVRIARTTMFWYANFGRSIRRDFTFRIPLAAEDAFKGNGPDLGSLGGRRVRVRGWLFEDNGPMIEITHPLALEILE